MGWSASNIDGSWVYSELVVLNSSGNVSEVRSNFRVIKITYSNDTGNTVDIKSFTCQLGSGDTDGDPIYSGGKRSDGTAISYTVNGGTISVAAVYNGSVISRSTVTRDVACENHGARLPDPESGWFVNIATNTNYSVTFNLTSTVRLSPGGEAVFYVGKYGSSNTILSSRYNDTRHLVTGVVEVYKPPITGSVTITANDQTILYGNSASVSYNVTVTGAPSGYQQSVSGGGSLGTITSQRSGTVSVTITHPDYEGSLTDSDTYVILCKLNAPTTSLSSSTSGFTIGTNITPTVSEGNNPSGCERYHQVSLNSSSTWTNVSVPYTISSGSSVRFRTSLSKVAGYTSSDWGSPSSTVSIYYEPRSMSSNGFTVNYRYTPPNGTETNLPTGDNVAVPTGSVKINWSSFLASKNLGRFNYYRVYIYKEGTTTSPLASQSGSNDPNSSKSQTFTISPDWAGQRIYLKLECLCRWPDSTSGALYGPNTSTGVFTSSSFLVGGYPEVPVVKYPLGTTFSSANKRLRLIFTVSNPPYLSDWDITDVEVEVRGTSTRTYKYSTSPAHFYSKMSNKPDTIPSGTILDFTTPEVDNISSGTTYRIRCSNQYMTGDWTGYYFLNFISLDYMVQNRKLLETDMIKLHQSLVDITRGYTNYNSNLYSEISVMYPPKVEQDKYLVKATGVYLGSSGIIKKLSSLYDLVSVNSVPPSGLGLNFSQIDTITTTQVVDAQSPPFSVSGGYYQPKGNYFNIIINVLKSML